MSGNGRGIWIEVSAGELVDRITILRIKAERFVDEGKRRRVAEELAGLETVGREVLGRMEGLVAELREVNEALWEVEDGLRGCERRGEFGAGFVELAKSVYRLNDRRWEIKRWIDEAVGAGAGEQKEYVGLG